MFKLWRIAVRDVGRNKRRSGLTLIAVALGLALVIALHGLEMGAMEGSVENNIRVQSGHVQVRAESYEEDKVSLKWEDLLEEPLGRRAGVRHRSACRDGGDLSGGSGWRVPGPR
jgi:ABC-type lipoprotein release transport system permease subunit